MLRICGTSSRHGGGRVHPLSKKSRRCTTSLKIPITLVTTKDWKHLGSASAQRRRERQSRAHPTLCGLSQLICTLLSRPRLRKSCKACSRKRTYKRQRDTL